MFTLARQCELSQDWTRCMNWNLRSSKAIAFLRSCSSGKRQESSALGRYGLLPLGLADGGIAGPCEELTNTLWALAGLKAIAEAGESEKIDSLKDARAFYSQLQRRIRFKPLRAK